MTDDQAPPSGSPTTDPRSGDDALLEEIRSLRLWANSLEERLARKSEQVEVWRERAEERKQTITDLRRRLSEAPRPGMLRRLLARGSRPSSPAHPPPSAPPKASAPTPSTNLPSAVFPTVRVAAVADSRTELPGVLEHLDLVRVGTEEATTAIESADLLVVVGQGARSTIDRWPRAARWVAEGHPTVAVDDGSPGALSAADLEVFDPSDDLFGLDPVRGGDHRLPTVSRLAALARDHPARRALAEAGIDVDGSTPSLFDLERRAVAGLRRLRTNSSPEVVAARLFDTVGVPVPVRGRDVLAVLVSRRPAMAVAAIDRLIAQTHRPLRVAVGLHGPAGEAESSIRARLEHTGIPHSIARFDLERPLGMCMNDLVETSPGDVILKIDDDDLYSPVYVEDMIGALAYAGADIVGKASMYVRLVDGSFVLLAGPAYRSADFVYGPTITMTRNAWDLVRFPARHRRIDSKLMWGARNAGLTVIATHQLDACVVRHDAGHTWTANDDYFRAAGRPVEVDWDEIRTDALD